MLKRMGFFLVTVLIGWGLTLGVPDAWPGPTERLDKNLIQKRNDLKKIRKDLTLTKEKEKEVRVRESSILDSLSAIEMELYKKQKELRVMEPQLAKTTERAQQTNQQIVKLKDRKSVV